MQKRLAELEKAENATHLFDEMVQVAEEEKRKILTDALHQKDLLISEAKQLAEKKQETILQEAYKKAEFIATEAAQKVANLEKELEDWFVDGVKRTTKLVVNKLINDDTDLKTAYVDSLVNEFTANKYSK